MKMLENWGTHTNGRGIQFFITAEQQVVMAEADYRLWLAQARLDEKPDSKAMLFRVVVKRDVYPDEPLATIAARGAPLEHIRGLLEMTDETGRPLFFPHVAWHEGWAVI